MRDKFKLIFDSRATWALFGGVVGSAWGDQAAAVVGAVGSLVMALL